MTKLTDTVAFTASSKPTLVMQEANYHSREGNALHKWINECTPGDTASTLSNEITLEYDIPEDYQVFITQLDAGLMTVSKACKYHLVRCSAVSGGGTATAVSGEIDIDAGAAFTGSEHRSLVFDPPIRIRYADGNRSIAIRVDADAATNISAAWHGWVESEA